MEVSRSSLSSSRSSLSSFSSGDLPYYYGSMCDITDADALSPDRIEPLVAAHGIDTGSYDFSPASSDDASSSSSASEVSLRELLSRRARRCQGCCRIPGCPPLCEDRIVQPPETGSVLDVSSLLAFLPPLPASPPPSSSPPPADDASSSPSASEVSLHERLSRRARRCQGCCHIPGCPPLCRDRIEQPVIVRVAGSVLDVSSLLAFLPPLPASPPPSSPPPPPDDASSSSSASEVSLHERLSRRARRCQGCCRIPGCPPLCGDRIVQPPETGSVLDVSSLLAFLPPLPASPPPSSSPPPADDASSSSSASEVSLHERLSRRARRCQGCCRILDCPPLCRDRIEQPVIVRVAGSVLDVSSLLAFLPPLPASPPPSSPPPPPDDASSSSSASEVSLHERLSRRARRCQGCCRIPGCPPLCGDRIMQPRETGSVLDVPSLLAFLPPLPASPPPPASRPPPASPPPSSSPPLADDASSSSSASEVSLHERLSHRARRFLGCCRIPRPSLCGDRIVQPVTVRETGSVSDVLSVPSPPPRRAWWRRVLRFCCICH